MPPSVSGDIPSPDLSRGARGCVPADLGPDEGEGNVEAFARARNNDLAFIAVFLVGGLAGPAAANMPQAFPFFNRFNDVNPCTGLVHIVTVTGTLYVQDNNGALVMRVDRNITTSSGYAGQGRFVHVVNGSIEKFMLGDRLVSPSGSVIDAGFHLVVDLSDGSVKHFQGGVFCAQP